MKMSDNWTPPVRKEIFDIVGPGATTAAISERHPRRTYNMDELKLFVVRSIWKARETKSRHITKHVLLRLVYNHHNSHAQLMEVMSDILGKEHTVINAYGEFEKGIIIQKGDGIPGKLGNGPIIYIWKEIK
jgi:hypothetical protein